MRPNSAVTRSGSSETTGAPPHSVPFRHELLLYEDGDDGFVAATLALVAGALAGDGGVLVAVSPPRASALREALGEQAVQARFTDACELARNPARLIPLWQDFVSERDPDDRRELLAIGEAVWPGRSAAELSECERHEALVNLAFAAQQRLRVVCPYDLDSLADPVIEAARANHPLIASDKGVLANERCSCLRDPPRPFAGALPAPAGTVVELDFGGVGGLAALRHGISAWGGEEGLSAQQIDDLVLAVDELAANSIRHGGGEGTLRRWREHGTLMCEIRDAGTIEAPLIGRVRPATDQTSGRGMWLVNQLCDLVQIRSSDDGTAVRVHKHLPSHI